MSAAKDLHFAVHVRVLHCVKDDNVALRDRPCRARRSSLGAQPRQPAVVLANIGTEEDAGVLTRARGDTPAPR